MLGMAARHNFDGSYFDTFDILVLQDSAQGAVENQKEGQNRDKPDERAYDGYEPNPPDYFHPHNSSRSSATGLGKSNAEGPTDLSRAFRFIRANPKCAS